MRELQEKYFQDLQSVGARIQGHVFPYPFYFSRVLDLERAQQERADQRSLRFDNYGGMTVVELTGNYFGAYSTELVNKSHRALRTFQDVMLPILELTVPAFKDNPDVEGFAMEISHHIRAKSMGQNVERPENIVLALSKDAALRLVNAKNDNDRQAALLDGRFYFNGEPFVLYLSDQAAQEAAKQLDHAGASQAPKNGSKASSRRVPRLGRELYPFKCADGSAAGHVSGSSGQNSGDRPEDDRSCRSRELDPQAHFVSYAPPTIIAFRKGAYLEFSVATALPLTANGSRYKMAALAFDNHIAHLLRPMMAYFKGDLDFDGVAFSTTIHQADKSVDTQGTEAVEFFFPADALHCYEAYDCTGQQLIDEGSVLINGERVSLDLQTAESGDR